MVTIGAKFTGDERELFDERAGICEFHGNLSREEAEQIAFDEVIRARLKPKEEKRK